jgi:hypothetical protein
LGLLASLLVVFFRAETTALIPLYAIGVFLSFTMSQLGMVVRTWKVGHMKPGEIVKTRVTTLEHDAHWRRHMTLSAVGAIVTGMVVIVFTTTKFSQGAWFVALLIPCLVFVFFRIHYHYREVAQLLSLSGKKWKWHVGPVLSLLLVEDVHAGTLRMVEYAKSLNCPWKAIHIAVNPDKVEVVQQKWAQRVDEGELVILQSPYRHLAEPLRDYIEATLKEMPEGYINVIMGHLAMETFWGQTLHQNSMLVLTLALQNLERVTMTNVPYQISRLKLNGENGGLPAEPVDKSEAVQSSY